jgi:hypothetical protein
MIQRFSKTSDAVRVEASAGRHPEWTPAMIELNFPA